MKQNILIKANDLDSKINSIMPFGEHSGKAMANVPESWLLWFWGENKSSYKEFGEFGLRPDQFKIMKYIEDSLDAKNLD